MTFTRSTSRTIRLSTDGAIFLNETNRSMLEKEKCEIFSFRRMSHFSFTGVVSTLTMATKIIEKSRARR